MSISWTLLLRWGEPGEHHKHQLDPVAEIRGWQSSIASISWTASLRLGGARQHQLDCFVEISGVRRAS